MNLRHIVVLAVAAPVLAGCQTDAPLLANEEAIAKQTALRRGQFDAREVPH